MEFEKDYHKDEIVSHISGLEHSEQASQNFDDETIVGIEKQYDAVLHYDEKTVEKEKKPNKKDNLLKPKQEKLSDERSSEHEPRLISSRNSSRMLFADINIEDIE